MAVYTKTGDKGETKVFDANSGKLVGIKKDSCKIKSIGALDELNSYLGIVGGLQEIQKNLFTINSILAGGNLVFNDIEVGKLEKQIDVWEGKLPVLQNFIIYGGTKKASHLFYARALCRRAERELVEMNNQEGGIDPKILKYINRLSDYLFMMARVENHISKSKEILWDSNLNR